MEGPVKFVYNEAAYRDGIMIKGDFVCDCCGSHVKYIYGGAIYMCGSERPLICPDCLASGEAAKKYDAQFVNSASKAVHDPEKREVLFHRTPGYPSWQGDYFPECCGDFCTFVGDVGVDELTEMGIADEVFTDYVQRGGNPCDCEVLQAVGSTAGYLFRCLHCGKYHLHVDMD